ncbi:hypothetical protein RFI_14135 [Reticulomyxa filosa]|uniref:Uncharacterized protein n=1 Tax=Reticulomyxa filosa TaxID=46433 RepID=X6NCJ8_RETFI|nr:hypothetical protein RFI_14135 [Reticulomyxa filosa]|eukprot:ETO23047.1 hypothetical protein RFI_14135 [Reticulomyxa filosa]
MDSAEYFLAELLSALIWHVHLLSHENLIDSLPEELNSTNFDKDALGKSSANKDSNAGKHMEYRKRNENDNMETESKRKESKNYGAKLVGMTKSLVGAPFRSTPKVSVSSPLEPQPIFERVAHVYFVDDLSFRSSKLSQLVTALKGLRFRFESFEFDPFASIFDLSFIHTFSKKKKNVLFLLLQSRNVSMFVDTIANNNWGSTIPSYFNLFILLIWSREGVQRICEEIFETLSQVLSECVFHSSTHTYTDAQRRKLFEKFTQISNSYTALNEAKLVSNVLRFILAQLALLLDAYTRSVRRQGNEDNEMNPLWIVDDLFHMKKKLSALNLNHLQFRQSSCLLYKKKKGGGGKIYKTLPVFPGHFDEHETHIMADSTVGKRKEASGRSEHDNLSDAFVSRKANNRNVAQIYARFREAKRRGGADPLVLGNMYDHGFDKRKEAVQLQRLCEIPGRVYEAIDGNHSFVFTFLFRNRANKNK